MCDGPALLWLSRQQGPRLWVCDGAATGAGDHSEIWHGEECAAIMQAAGIVQIVRVGWGAVQASRTLTHGSMRSLDVTRDLVPVLRMLEAGRV